jgi:hypothetical protein
MASAVSRGSLCHCWFASPSGSYPVVVLVPQFSPHNECLVARAWVNGEKWGVDPFHIYTVPLDSLVESGLTLDESVVQQAKRWLGKAIESAY